MLKALNHVVHATGYSIAGLKHLLSRELAARIEVVAGLASLAWFLILGRPIRDIVVLAILFCVLISVESLNTSIERIVDHLSKEWTEFGRVTKDMGSTAVFFLLIACGIFIAAVTADAAGLIAL